MSTVGGYLEYHGGYHDKHGRHPEYGGGAQYCGDIMSTVRGYLEYCRILSTMRRL